MAKKLTLSQERVLNWMRVDVGDNRTRWHTPGQMHATSATMKALVAAGHVEEDANGRLYRLKCGEPTE